MQTAAPYASHPIAYVPMVNTAAQPTALVRATRHASRVTRHASPQNDANGEAIGRIVKAGKAAGILAPDESLTRQYLGLGVIFFGFGVDTALLVNATSALVARFKSTVNAPPTSQTY